MIEDISAVTANPPPPPGNADPAELAKFSALAHRWWDPQSEFKPLHDINPLRLGWIDAQAVDAEAVVLVEETSHDADGALAHRRSCHDQCARCCSLAMPDSLRPTAASTLERC